MEKNIYIEVMLVCICLVQLRTSCGTYKVNVNQFTINLPKYLHTDQILIQ